MGLKDIFKPNVNNAVLTILLIIIGIYVMLPFEFVKCTEFLCGASMFRYILYAFFALPAFFNNLALWTIDGFHGFGLILFLVDFIYSYLLACLILFLYQKIKK